MYIGGIVTSRLPMKNENYVKCLLCYELLVFSLTSWKLDDIRL